MSQIHISAGASSPKSNATPSASTLAALSRIAAEEGGLAIGPGKEDFLAARLQSHLLRLKLPDLGAYARHLDDTANAAERRRFIEAITTHTTSFFRETAQYDWLRESGVANLLDRIGHRRPVEIWSAACSSGQELYSALMVLLGIAGPGESVDVVGRGTDLSGAILRRAEMGIYSRDEISGIPIELRRRFVLSARHDSDRFRMDPELRKRAHWSRANLSRPNSYSGIAADLIFLRNVLIYFDADVRNRVLIEVISRLRPGGYLLTGHSESIDARKYGLMVVKPSIYHKGE